jgi:hypothetical protein
MAQILDIDLDDIHYFDDIRQVLEEPTGKWLKRSLNSALAFILAYILLQFLYNGVTFFMGSIFGVAKSFGYPAYHFNKDPTMYSKNKVLLIFMSGPLVLLLTSLLSYSFFRLTRKVKNFMNIFWFWTATIGLVEFFVQFSLGLFKTNYTATETYIGFAVVSAWYDFPEPGLYFVAGFVVLLCLLLGLTFIRPFLTLSHSFKLANNFYGRRTLYLFLVVIPFFIAGAFIFLVSFPAHMVLLGFNLAGIALTILVGYLVLHNYKGVVTLRKNNYLDKISLVPIILVAIAGLAAIFIR